MLNYNPEAIPAFLRTWRVVRKEAAWLSKTHQRLFKRVINADWVIGLEKNENLAERVEAFASRYGRLQDTLGNKLFPRLLELIGQKGNTLIDVLNQVERIGLLPSTQSWLVWRGLRNRIVHEYIESPEEFAHSLNSANEYTKQLIAIVDGIACWLQEIGASA